MQYACLNLGLGSCHGGVAYIVSLKCVLAEHEKGQAMVVEEQMSETEIPFPGQREEYRGWGLVSDHFLETRGTRSSGVRTSGPENPQGSNNA